MNCEFLLRHLYWFNQSGGAYDFSFQMQFVSIKANKIRPRSQTPAESSRNYQKPLKPKCSHKVCGIEPCDP